LEHELSSRWMQRRELRLRTQYQPSTPPDAADSE
jgi:hypothetical protein